MRRPPQRRQAGGAVGVAAEEDRAAPPAHQPGAAQRPSDGLATDAGAVVLAEYQRDRRAGPAAAGEAERLRPQAQHLHHEDGRPRRQPGAAFVLVGQGGPRRAGGQQQQDEDALVTLAVGAALPDHLQELRILDASLVRLVFGGMNLLVWGLGRLVNLSGQGAIIGGGV